MKRIQRMLIAGRRDRALPAGVASSDHLRRGRQRGCRQARPPKPSRPRCEPAPTPRLPASRTRGGAHRTGLHARAGDAVREVVVIFGDATIEGRVNGDVVVVFGTAQLSSTAIIDGDLVVVGGSASVSSGAQVRWRSRHRRRRVRRPAGFMPGGGHVVIGPGALGGRLDAIVPWVTRGLFWGRPIVPDLALGLGRRRLVFLVSLALNLVFNRPVRACAETLAEKPLTAFAVGLLVLLLAGPVCLLLAVSVVGLAVVPFVSVRSFSAWIVGKVGVARGIGMSVVRQTSQESHDTSASFLHHRLRGDLRRLHGPGAWLRHMGDGRSVRSRRGHAGRHRRVQAENPAPITRSAMPPRPRHDVRRATRTEMRRCQIPEAAAAAYSPSAGAGPARGDVRPRVVSSGAIP